MKNNRIGFLIVILCLALSRMASGYLVGPALTLDQLAEESDIIFKGEAIESKPVQDEWFKDIPGFEACETRFKIISKFKGEAGSGEVRFRHYDKKAEGSGVGGSYRPQTYHFEPGKTYIVFADKSATGTRQTNLSHTMQMDSGALRCRDDKPVTAKSLREIYWMELIALRDSPVADDVVYAIRHLDEMSDSPGRRDHSEAKDFSRIEVLSAVRDLISRPEPEIAQAAIRLIGDGSPYLSDNLAPYWLGTIGVETPGLSQFEPGNVGGALAWRELVAVANSNVAPETRALAIRATGLVKAWQLHQRFMDAWLKATEIPVRAAAVLLLSDFARPCDYTTGQFAGFAADPAPEVRKCAAYAIGFMQNPDIVPILSKLIKDDDKAVRRAAMESLYSFQPDIPAVAAALKQDLNNPESQPLSLLALARENPGAYLEELARVVERKTTPTNSSGGQIPAFTAWKLLFKHLRAQPATDIRSGKWDSYLYALENVGQYSSSEPRDIYAFYLQRGLPERAAKYRAKAKKALTYDIDYYFDMVDKNPSVYEGN